MERQDYKWKFNEELKKLSPDATTINDALTQWKVISKESGLDNCICTYPNITRLNLVKNVITGNVIIVGECCVKKFKIEDTVLNCCECQRPLHITNKYVETLYKNGVCLDENISIIGHKKCGERINKLLPDITKTAKLIKYDRIIGSNARQLTIDKVKKFEKYYKGIIKSVAFTKDFEVELEYESHYEDYLQLLNIF